MSRMGKQKRSEPNRPAASSYMLRWEVPSPDANPCQGMRKHRVPRPPGTGRSTSEGMAGSDPACVKCLASLDGNERVKQTLAAREGRGMKLRLGALIMDRGGVCVPGGNIWWARWARPTGRKRGITRERSIGVSAHGHSTPPPPRQQAASRWACSLQLSPQSLS